MFSKDKYFKVFYDVALTGISIIKHGRRKWYNPVGWFVGRYYIKHIKPVKFWG